MLSGKEQAKLNKRKSFYSKLERQIAQSDNDNEKEHFYLINYQKQTIFPEYDDLTLILNDYTEKIKIDKTTVDEHVISIPDLDEGYFLRNMAKDSKIKIFKEETFENANGTIRKGSTGSIDDYNYQSAYNYYIQILEKDEFIKIIEKEKEEPTTYDIPVVTKKVETKRYVKTYRYPRRSKR